MKTVFVIFDTRGYWSRSYQTFKGRVYAHEYPTRDDAIQDIKSTSLIFKASYLDVVEIIEQYKSE